MAEDRVTLRQETPEQLLNFLGLVATCHRENDRHPTWTHQSVESFILTNGQWFKGTPRPADVPQMQQGNCYGNATLVAATRPDLMYVEGYATSVIPLRHAWLVNEDDEVIDPTWEDAENRHYFGVPVPTKQLRRMMVSAEMYSVFSGNIDLVAEILRRGKFPSGDFLNRLRLGLARTPSRKGLRQSSTDSEVSP